MWRPLLGRTAIRPVPIWGTSCCALAARAKTVSCRNVSLKTLFRRDTGSVMQTCQVIDLLPLAGSGSRRIATRLSLPSMRSPPMHCMQILLGMVICSPITRILTSGLKHLKRALPIKIARVKVILTLLQRLHFCQRLNRVASLLRQPVIPPSSL
jgi:hypothetical protein